MALDSWQTHCKILWIILLEEFRKLNVPVATFFIFYSDYIRRNQQREIYLQERDHKQNLHAELGTKRMEVS